MNTPIDDGGPAFPHGPLGDTMHGEDGRVWHQYPAGAGMCLRDWFAANASEDDIAEHRLDDFGRPFPNISRECARYKYADAMIRERKGFQP